MAVISAVLLECVLAPEKARWASVVTTGPKPDVFPSMRGSGNHTPSSKGFTIHNASTTICINSSPMINMAKYLCNGTIIGKKRIPGVGFGKTERVPRDARRVHRKTSCSARVGVGRSDGGHESNPSCETISKIPSVCRIKAVFMMDIDKCVKEA